MNGPTPVAIMLKVALPPLNTNWSVGWLVMTGCARLKSVKDSHKPTARNLSADAFIAVNNASYHAPVK